MTPSRERFAWRMSPFVAMAAGVPLMWNALRAPFSLDDLLQRAMARGGFPAPRGMLDMYDFVRPSERDGFVASGALPWWTDENFSVRFFRPLSSMMIFFEHRWFASPSWMHLLSVVWWAAATLAASHLFRRVLSERAAALATVVFALAPCHVLPLAMVAQREVLVSSTFGLLGLGALLNHQRLRAAALFALALAAGEYGLCVGGYVLALAITQPAPMRERIRVVWPFALPAAAYLGVRAILGYGATGTGFYRDPIHSPWLFLRHAPRSLLTLVVDAWSTFDASTWPTWALLATTAAIVFVNVALRGAERWLVVGSLFALLPVTASAPDVRLIGPAMIGVAAAIGALADGLLARSRIFILGAVAVLVLHLGHAPIASRQLASALFDHATRIERKTMVLGERLRSCDGVVVVALASWETAFFGATRGHNGRNPVWRVLVTARHALMLRVDARTVDVIVPKGQGFFPVGADDIFRPEDRALRAGDERDVPGMHVSIVSASEMSPPRIRFAFDRELEDASLTWLSESVDGYRDTSPPTAGFGKQLSP